MGFRITEGWGRRAFTMAVGMMALSGLVFAGAANASTGVTATSARAVLVSVEQPRQTQAGDQVKELWSYQVIPDAGTTSSNCVVHSLPGYAAFPCWTFYQEALWNDGRYEYSGIGTDNAVWDNWQVSAGGSWYGWTSLGGHDLQYGVWWNTHPTLVTYGSDLKEYCKSYNGGWGGWFTCNER